ncbi:MAG: trypsin-like peptidase domain-containing protein [Flavobacteriales bacterium]|nr:MAG: trypsin-like peptidase domain-containing protein [Flavobacteriales bacterium]
MRVALNIALVAALLSCAPLRAQDDIGGVAIYERVSPAVVQVFAYGHDLVQRGRASGVILRDKGWLITNYHATGKGTDISARRGDDNLNMLHVVRADSTLDIVVLAIDTINAPDWYSTVPLLPRARPNDVHEGGPVYAIGNPYGFTNTISRGIVSGLRQDSVYNFIQTDAAISPGNSGGALVNGRGELIGMPTWQYGSARAQNLNFAIPIAEVLEWPAENARKDFELVDPDDPLIAGGRALRNGNHRAAIDHFTRMGKKEVRDWHLGLYYTGVAYEFLHQPDSANACYLSAARLDPRFARAHWRSSLIFLDKGHWELAVEAQGKAYAIEPHLRSAHRKQY